MAERPKPGFYAVIPADVRYDERIPPNAKLLYAEISALSDASGVCNAGDEWFLRCYGLSDRTVRRLLSALEEAAPSGFPQEYSGRTRSAASSRESRRLTFMADPPNSIFLLLSYRFRPDSVNRKGQISRVKWDRALR